MDVAVGSTHCLALTDDGEVHSWGSNDKLQHFDTLFSNKKQPKALPGLNSKHIFGISCGPGQVKQLLNAVNIVYTPQQKIFFMVLQLLESKSKMGSS